MKRLCGALITIAFAASGSVCLAETACRTLVVRSQVEAAAGGLTLADLLGSGTCPQWYRAAAQVSLGATPRAGSVRVIEGREIRLLMEALGEREFTGREFAGHQAYVPERVVVRQTRAFKSCGEIARFIGAAVRQEGETGGSQAPKNMDCAAARNIPEDASLELLKTSWNAGLERREFALRCRRPEDCIPFLVWFREPALEASLDGLLHGRKTESARAGSSEARLIKPGQTAMLTWEQAGIRVVLPVTCLEAGGLGEFVRVRFKNAAGILRAEIVGAGAVRASL
ncbi:MAG: flagella basal body P-ring formation protein FlgA [Candidatus Sulfotelmatobacter sp.]